MGYGSSTNYMKSPKREEQEVPDTFSTDQSQELLGYNNNSNQESDDQFMQGFLGCIGGGDEKDIHTQSWEGFMDWELEEDIINNNIIDDTTSMDLDSYLLHEEEEEDESHYMSSSGTTTNTSSSSKRGTVKSEVDINNGGGYLWDIHDGEDDDVKGSSSLKLNLNYQQVLDAWSDRGPLRAQGCPSSSSLAANGAYYMGEVPVMEEERTARREASVLRYKEKRQSRLFSKKIRYQVRKLNADKRPRLKGRFVKRS